MDRRQFVRTVTAAVAVNSASEIAMAENTPVRDTPLHGAPWGTEFYDGKETAELADVVETRHPFRWGGGGKDTPMKVLTFEKEFAQHMNTKYALAVTSGTAALEVGYHALGIGPGDE